MIADIKQLAIPPLRFVVRQVLQRPWLKRYLRGALTRMPRVHSFLLRVMFKAPRRRKDIFNTKDISPHAQLVQSALKQAMRNQRP